MNYKNGKIHQDTNPNHWPYYVLMGFCTGNKVTSQEYRGFKSIAEAKEWIDGLSEQLFL